MVIPENKIEEIRSAANIVDVISEYIQLKKRGRNYIGLCPFHKEKTPSFTVSSEKQMFHCFGCNAGGNVFRFLMDYENVSFPEAVQQIAARVGIVIETTSNVTKVYDSENENFYEINTVAARYFSQNLLENKHGETAREYFAGRNVKVQTQRIFGLGYALQSWDGFVNYASANNVDMERARTLGLIEKKDSGGYYDKFRSRIIFPIFSSNGRVIAFGGRIMENAQNTAKYLNSPESAIYVKRKTLYGLFHSKDEIRRLDKAILVEGYLDLISLYQAGIKNVVASCGTALTEEQAQLLSRYTRNIVVFYDSDNAGIKASLRSIEIFLKQDFDVKIAELPAGEDPDSFVNRNGREGIEEAIKRAQSFLEYQSQQYEKQGMFSDPSLQTQAIRGLVESASFVGDELKRTVLLKTIARKYGLREKLLEDELQTQLKEKNSLPRSMRRQEQTAKAAARTVRAAEQQVTQSATKRTEVSIAEKEIIRLLFQGDNKVIGYIFDNLTPEDFTTQSFQYLAEMVYDVYVNGGDTIPGALIEKIKDETLRTYVLNNAVDRYSISKTWEQFNPGLPEPLSLMKYAKDAVRSLRLYRIDSEILYNSQRIESAENEGEILELMKYNNALFAEKKIIQNSL